MSTEFYEVPKKRPYDKEAAAIARKKNRGLPFYAVEQKIKGQVIMTPGHVRNTGRVNFAPWK